MKESAAISNADLHGLIRKGLVTLAGNKKLRIFGNLRCTQGKRMLNKNRVFFVSANEAQSLGYRPCGHCMKVAYKKWKDEQFVR